MNLEHLSDNTHSFWFVTVRGTLRCWKMDGSMLHVKGSISFRSIQPAQLSSPPYFRIEYKGDQVLDSNPSTNSRGYYVSGSLEFPGSWKLEHRKFKSDNAKARGVLLIFNNDNNHHGISRVQIMVPVTDEDDGKLIVHTVEKADREWIEWHSKVKTHLQQHTN